MKNYNLLDRLTKFSIDILKITDQFPKDYAGKHLSQQLIRSGTSPALNYSEARGAESRADFKHKISIVLKEPRETQTALKIIAGRKYIENDMLETIQSECTELVAIFAASVKTVKKNQTKGSS